MDIFSICVIIYTVDKTIIKVMELYPKKKKQELLEILDNPAGKVIAVDVDGTICEGEFWGEKEEPKPILYMINFVNELYRKGAIILIYTARNPMYFEATRAWLEKYNVCRHGINMQRKPGADVYIDDKALNIEDITNR